MSKWAIAALAWIVGVWFASWWMFWPHGRFDDPQVWFAAAAYVYYMWFPGTVAASIMPVVTVILLRQELAK